MFGIGRKFKRTFGSLGKMGVQRELDRIRHQPRFVHGYTNLFKTPFKFHDGLSFEATYKELFQEHIYEFKPSATARIILDCGANMGLSVLYFSLNYPDHKIIAFEPDPLIFSILEENVRTFGLKNVTLHNKAVWTQTETLKFHTDGGMGGRVGDGQSEKSVTEVQAVALKEFINEDVDFIKIDIEGAEMAVIEDCKNVLHKANCIFFEYHNPVEPPQKLHELMGIVADQGFTYYIKESYVKQKPFTDTHIITEGFDMALNVFCYKK